MKAITISQPYAGLIADGHKWVENRNVQWHYRGEIAIHAGKGTQYINKEDIHEYQTGCFVAVAELVACFHIQTIDSRKLTMPEKTAVPGRTWRDIGTHRFISGPYCLVLSNVRKLAKTIPFRGAQGLWTAPDELFAGVEYVSNQVAT